MSSKDNVSNSESSSVIHKKSRRGVIAKHGVIQNKISNGQSEAVKKKGDQKDKRVQLAKYFIAGMFFITTVGMFAAEKVSVESFSLVVMFFILSSIIYVGFFALRDDLPNALVFSLLSLYVWMAFPFKLMIAVNDPGSLWVSQILFDPKVVSEEIVDSFFVVFPALVFLLLGLFLLHRTRHKKYSYTITKVSHIKFISVIAFLICLRLFNQEVLDIGIPGVKPTILPVPYLTGILELLSRPVLLAVVNLYFYYVVRMNNKKIIWISLSLLLTNVVLGLRVGYKSELVLQMLLLIYYSFEVYPYLSKTSRKFMVTVTVSMVVVVVLVYPLVNHYRNAILSGADFSEAVEAAQTRSEREEKSLSFIDRVNGVSEFYAATKLGAGEKFGFDAMFNDDVTDLIKQKIYGTNKDDAISAFGTTFFSVVYLIGGGIFMSVFGFVVGWLIRWSLMFLKFKIFKSSFTFQAYLPIVCILWVKLLSSGGNMFLPMKELFLVVVCLFLLERYATTSKV